MGEAVLGKVVTRQIHQVRRWIKGAGKERERNRTRATERKQQILRTRRYTQDIQLKRYNNTCNSPEKAHHYGMPSEDNMYTVTDVVEEGKGHVGG